MLNYRNYFEFTLNNSNKFWTDYSGKKTDVGVYTVASYFFDKFIKGLSADTKNKIFTDIPHLADKNKFSDQCLKKSEAHDAWDWGKVYKGLLQAGESCLVCIPGYYHISVKKDTGKNPHPSAWRVVQDLVAEEKNITQGLKSAEYATIVKDLFTLRYGVAPEDYKNESVEYFLPGMEVKKIKTEEKKTEETTSTDIIYYMVTTDGLNLRKSESTKSGIVIALNKGIIVEFIKEGKAEEIGGYKGKWINVRVSKGVEGWCYDRFLKKMDSKQNFLVIDEGKKKVRNVVVFLNPGHKNNKYDYGSVGFTKDWLTFSVKNVKEREGLYDKTILREANIVLQIALKLKSQLEANKYSVEMTRTTSEEVKSLNDMVKSINKKLTEESIKSKIAVVISLHANSMGKKTLSKEELKKVRTVHSDGYYYYAFENGTNSTIPVPDTSKNGGLIYTLKTSKNTKGDTILYKAHPKSIILQDNIASELSGLQPGCDQREANYQVLRETREIPGVLLEFGYMTNPDDLTFMTNEKNQKSICEKIVAGLNKCFK